MRWCGCATRRRRWASTAASRPSAQQLWQRFTPIIDNYRRYVRRTDRLQRLELVGQPGDRTRCRGSFRRRACSPGEIKLGDVGQTASAFGNIFELAVVLPQLLRRVRGVTCGHYPARRTGRRQRTGAAAAHDRHRGHRNRFRRTRRRRSPHSRWRATDFAAGPAARPWRRPGDHRSFGHRQDHAVAQPGGAVAVRDGHTTPTRGRQRDDVLVPVAVRAAG